MDRADLTKTIDLSKECLVMGKFSFKTVAEAAASIVGVGGIVKASLAFLPDEISVTSKLNELGNNIGALADKMNSRFDDMKAFITESNFYLKSTSNLTNYMTDCIKHPAQKEALQNFEDAYNKNSPLNMTYSVINIVEQDSTNPLKKAMDADPLKTSTTFDKWSNTIDGVLGQFLFLEAFACGLLKNKSIYGTNRIIERSNKLFKLIGEWREGYKKNALYWPGLENYIGEYLDTHKHLTLEQKADELKKQMDTILTNDAFYLVLFKEPEWWSVGSIICHQALVRGQLIESRNRGKCGALIYRSKQANLVESGKLDKMESKTLGIWASCDPKYDLECLLDMDWIHNTGFLCIVSNENVEIRSANCPRRSQGPGFLSSPKKMRVGIGCVSIQIIVGYI